MRPIRLDMAGFTVFREETTVDFTDADFFALVGPTGAGKSTVLDAICFALYGAVPRWGGAKGLVNALAPAAPTHAPPRPPRPAPGWCSSRPAPAT